MEDKTPSGQPIVDREKTAPFLIRAFVKTGSFHRISQFEDGPVPIADELQIFTWKDATLYELLTTIRNSAPSTLEYRHPLARYSFRTIYADAGNRGQFAQKELGVVYSRDTLGDLGTVEQLPLADTADANDDSKSEDADPVQSSTLARQKDARTLDELRFVPGDYLCVAVMLPKNVQASFPGEATATSPSLQKGPAPANGWKNAGVGGVGRGALGSSGPGASAPGTGRGGGHWRGGSDAPPQPARGRGERGGGARGERDGGRFRDDRDRDRDRDRRPPLPRRESPPPRAPWSDRERGAQRRSPSRSRSRSPPRRRR
ncbi:Sin3 associated polypeptide p18-domain-containing protein [Lactarius hatsudake]|nr:Sin3 associated polypeptide p18-domain-containing protein [Lactarius hatsudake]